MNSATTASLKITSKVLGRRCRRFGGSSNVVVSTSSSNLHAPPKQQQQLPSGHWRLFMRPLAAASSQAFSSYQSLSLQQRHSFTTTTSSSIDLSSLFDPWKHPTSAALLRQVDNNEDDGMLSVSEKELQAALQQYQDVVALPPLYDDCFTESESTENHRCRLLSIVNNLQQSYMELEYWQEALELEQDKCQQHLLVSGEDDDAHYMYDSIHAQGKLHVRIVTDSNDSNAQYHASTAFQLYEQALHYYQSTDNNRIQQGHVQISMAGWHFLLHQDYDASLQCLEQAETIFLSVLVEKKDDGESGDNQQSSSQNNTLLYTLLVKCFDNQGLIFRLRGDYSTALEKYQKALDVLDHVDDVEGSGDGNVIESSQENQQQLVQLRRAMQMHVGDMYMALEDSQQSLEAYQELLEEIQMQQDEDNNSASMEGVLYHNIATIHVDHGDYDVALEEFRKSIDAKEQASNSKGSTSTNSSYHPELAQTWNMMGGLLAGIFEEKGQALECFQKALMIARINASASGTDPQHDPDVLSALQNIATMESELKEQQQQQRADKQS